MKRIHFLSILTFLTLMLSVTSCNKFGDINKDPLRPTSIDPVMQLVNIQMRYGGDQSIYLRAGTGIIYSLLQQMGGNFTGNSGSTYAYSESIFSRLWVAEFPATVPNIVGAVESASQNPAKPNLYAMVRIMKVLVFLRLTDMYGDIPYSQAGKGFVELIPRPKYDKQEDIYNDFFKELKEAHDLLDASKDAVTQDQFFGGDVTKWKKLANSIRLRIAMRLTKVNPTLARSEAESAIASGVMTSNSDLAYVKHEYVQASSTEFRGNGIAAAIMAVNDPARFYTTFINMLKPVNATDPVDPRLDGYSRNYLPLNPLVVGERLYERVDITNVVNERYATAANPWAGVMGLNPGATSFVNNPSRSTAVLSIPGVGSVSVLHKDQRRQIANYLIYFDAPSLIFTYSEVALLQAEAKVRGWNAGSLSADQYYKEGIRASIQQLSLFRGAPTFTGVDAFVNSKTLTPGSELKEINEQLYLSLFLNPIENFSNWRRSGFPALTPTGTSGRPIPRRLQYPLNEIEQNSDNVQEAIQNIKGVEPGGDSFLNRVWWDAE